jgi:Uma2 family endonuclease
LADVAVISRELAEDVGRIILRTEGFSVEDYLSLDGPYLVEFVDGSLQILPMPTAFHQAIAFVLANLLVAWSKPDPLARTKLAPFRVRLTERLYREPDVCFMLGQNAARRSNAFWDGADLVIEIISGSNRAHDVHTKRSEYAAAGIPEYWIIDSELRLISVFTLDRSQYVLRADFHAHQVAGSVVLKGFSVDVSELFATAEAQA